MARLARSKFLSRLAASAVVAVVLGGSHDIVRASEAGIRFRDVAEQAGVTAMTRNDAQGHKYQVETMLGGVAVLDFDGDGWMDVYMVNGASLPSLEKTGPGVLEFPVSQ